MAELRTEDLLERLVADVRPVRRVVHPVVGAAIWLAVAGAVVTTMVILHGLRPDLMETFARPFVKTSWIASILTGLLAAVAAFHIALPDRSSRWALLPLPPLLLWIAGLGYGCFTDWLRVGPDGLVLGTSFSCFAVIALTSLPLGTGMLFMLRHAAPVRPALTAMIGSLSMAALVSAGLQLFHYLDAAIMVLVWHLGPVSVVVGVFTLANRRIFSEIEKIDPMAAAAT
ncbi:hypothetical protein ABIE65_005364 [Constrictibacter sp. MBR-5]|uniref:DUF1109 domain-containing protein n=1 Tax=Constrictibacter sp. MBR-5 TaxID=3156467 RepID=UPI0033946439